MPAKKFDLKAAREKLRYTQDALAAILRIPKRTLQNWEKDGAPHPHVVKLALDHIDGKRYAPADETPWPKYKLTASDRAECAQGVRAITYSRLPDGTWLQNLQEVAELPLGTLYWQTGMHGVWHEFRRNASASKFQAGDLTGRQGRWRPWHYWTDEDPSDEISSEDDNLS